MDPAVSAWWEDFYREDLIDLYMVREDENDRDRAVSVIGDLLALEKGDRVFDQCCGCGALSLPLLSRGMTVIGVDQCAAYIDRAWRDAGSGAEYIVGDAFAFVPAPCDAAFNWCTGFGYAESDEENVRMLRCAHAALRPGGRFALEFPHMPHLVRNFERVIERRRTSVQGEMTLRRECAIAAERGVLEQVWTIVTPDGRRRATQSAVRMYAPADLERLFRNAGFIDIRLYSGEGRKLEAESARCVCVGRREET